MIIFYVVLLLFAIRYRHLPFDLYREWKEERDLMRESLKPYPGLDYEKPKPFLRRVK